MFDPGVLLGAQVPKLPDPFAQAQTFMSLAQLANQNALSKYALAKSQREDQAAQDMQSALPALLKAGWNDQAVTDAMTQYPNAAAAIQSQAMAAAKARFEQQKEAAQTSKFQAEATKENLASFANVAGAAAAQVKAQQVDPMRALGQINFAAQKLGIDPQMFGLTSVAGQAMDPGTVGSILDRAAGMATTAYQRAELAGQAQTRAETGRHNLATEALTANAQAETGRHNRAEEGIQGGQLRVAQGNLAVNQTNADPFGILGLNKNAVGANGGQGATPVAQAMANGVHGDEFLATLPGELAGQVKALAEGRMQFPSGFALKSPQIQGLLAMVSQYDPTFDAVNYGARAATRKNFTSGSAATSLNALNTVMGHLDELDKAATALNNTSIPIVNTVVNAAQKATGDPRVNQFNVTKNAVVSELERAYRGTGGSEGDLRRMSDELNSSASPDQFRAVATQYVNLLKSKMDALGDQYNKGMGTTKDGLELLNPKAQATFNRLSGGQQAAPAPQSAPAGQTFNAMPDPAKFTGRRVQSDDGTVYKSDGSRWVREQ